MLGMYDWLTNDTAAITASRYRTLIPPDSRSFDTSVLSAINASDGSLPWR